MNDERRTWNEERYGYDVEGPCYACGAPTRYFVDEDGTPRDVALDPRAMLAAALADEEGEGVKALAEALVPVTRGTWLSGVPADKQKQADADWRLRTARAIAAAAREEER